MTNIQTKFANKDGDYYFCNLCNTWHRYRIDAALPGWKHIANLDEAKTNSPNPKYFFRSPCAAWHRCTNDPSSTGMARTTKTDEQFMDDERKNDKLSKIQNGMH